MIRKKLFAVAGLLVFSLACACQADLAKKIGAIISQPSQKDVRFSITVIKAKTGENIYTYKGELDMIPASNMKLLVTGAALKYLGKDFEYKTQVGMIGETLVIIGSGDPLLGDKVTDEKYGRKPGWILDDICQKLKEQNITDISDIVVDTSIFDDNRVSPNWSPDELNQSYAAEVCGLNYNCNFVEMTVENVGGRARISVEPKSSFLKIYSAVKTSSAAKDAVGAYRKPAAKPGQRREINTVLVSGTCNKKAGPFEVAIERPAAHFGLLLSERLAANGIRLKGNLIEKGIDKKGFKQIAEYKTTLLDCLTRCHKDSLNLAAEAMLKTVGRKVCNDGSWAGGRTAIEKYLKGLGVSEDEFKIDDGCGLSRENRVSADCIVTIIKSIYDSNDWEFYKQTLAVAGSDGTIENRFQNEKYKGKILAKTGYINAVRALSGVCSTSNGDYIFSILANNCFPRIDNIAEAIIDEYDVPAKMNKNTINDFNANIGDTNSNTKIDANNDDKISLTNAEQLTSITLDPNQGLK